MRFFIFYSVIYSIFDNKKEFKIICMKKRVFAYLHTHWDLEWYRDKQDFTLRLLEVFDIVLEELEKGKAPFFYFDGQVAALLDYLKYRKEKKELVKKLISENKLAIGPYFVSADSYLVNFISMLKNLDIGMKISKEFNQKEFIGYLSDIFGISNSVFQALKLKNIDKSLIWRGVNPEKINNNCNFIKDDIKTTWLAQGYFNDFLHNENIEGLKNYLDKILKYSNNNLLLPIGADHLNLLLLICKNVPSNIAIEGNLFFHSKWKMEMLFLSKYPRINKNAVCQMMTSITVKKYNRKKTIKIY